MGGQHQLLMMPKSNTFFPIRACTDCTPTDTDESLVDGLVPCFVSIGHALRQLHHSIQQSPPPVSGTGKSKLAVAGTLLSLGLFVDKINYSLEQKLSENDPSAFLKQAALSWPQSPPTCVISSDVRCSFALPFLQKYGGRHQFPCLFSDPPFPG